MSVPVRRGSGELVSVSPRSFVNGEKVTRRWILLRLRIVTMRLRSLLDALSEGRMGLAYEDNDLRIGRGIVGSFGLASSFQHEKRYLKTSKKLEKSVWQRGERGKRMFRKL